MSRGVGKIQEAPDHVFPNRTSPPAAGAVGAQRPLRTSLFGGLAVKIVAGAMLPLVLSKICASMAAPVAARAAEIAPGEGLRSDPQPRSSAGE
jgi:hypothetical protein